MLESLTDDQLTSLYREWSQETEFTDFLGPSPLNVQKFVDWLKAREKLATAQASREELLRLVRPLLGQP